MNHRHYLKFALAWLSLTTLTACGKVSLDVLHLSSVLHGSQFAILGLPSNSSISVTEGSTLALLYKVDPVSNTTTTVDIAIVASPDDPAVSFTSSLIHLTIPAGTSSGSFNIVSTVVSSSFSDRHFKLIPQTNGIAVAGASSSIDLTIQTTQVQTLPTVQWSAATASVFEAGAPITLTAQLSSTYNHDITVMLLTGGTAGSSDFTLAPSSVVIPVGSLSTNVTLTPVDNSNVNPDKTVTVTMSAATNATIGSTATETITLRDDDIAAFSIAGVQSNTLDTTSDTYLNYEATPKTVFASAAGADSYAVTIFESDGTTVKCATQTTSTPSLLMTGCSLTAGQSYKAKIVARLTAASVSREASNSPFSFVYNRAPVAVADHLLLAASGVAVTFDPRSNDSDADGDALTITAVSTPTAGSVTFTGTSITYTPDANAPGQQSFTYTISDGRGATASATVTASVMTPFTWTGAANDGLWTNAANWCGTVTTPGVNGACTANGTYPSDSTNTAHVAIFDGTAVHPNVSINAAVQCYGLVMAPSYAGTLTQLSGVGNTLTIGGAGYAQHGGAFVGGNAAISITSAVATVFLVSDGSYTTTSGLTTLVATGPTGQYILLVTNDNSTTVFNSNSASFILRGDATNSPTYNYGIAAGVNSNQFSNLTFQSQAGTATSNIVYFNEGATVALEDLRVNSTLTIERHSGSGSVVLTGGHTIYAGSIVANSGALPTGFSIYCDGNCTYGSYGDGVLPVLVHVNVAPTYYWTSLTSDARVSGVFSVNGSFRAPTGTLFVVGSNTNQSPFISGNPSTAFFDPNNGTVDFVILPGTTSSVTAAFGITYGASPYTFNNLIIDGSNGVSNTTLLVHAQGQHTVLGNLSFVTTSTASDIAMSYVGGGFDVAGDLSFDGTPATGPTLPLYNEENITLNGSGTQTIYSLNGGADFAPTLNISKTSGSSVSLSGNFFGRLNAQIVNIHTGVLDLSPAYTFDLKSAYGDHSSTITVDSTGAITNSTGKLNYDQLVDNGTVN